VRPEYLVYRFFSQLAVVGPAGEARGRSYDAHVDGKNHNGTSSPVAKGLPLSSVVYALDVVIVIPSLFTVL
jgi:hypothetical protein